MGNKKWARVFILIQGAMMVFHLLVLFRIIPFDKVWGGQLSSVSDMYRFEGLAMLVHAFVIWLVGMRVGIFRSLMKESLLDKFLWLLMVFFLLNTVGNLLAKTTMEKGFAAVSLASAYLVWRVRYSQY
ncbi:hypothetical protein [Leadbetterella byssophila]|uniref:hypothetical protein n=1 Tax=Leadbetterella byssophila TaxID=316068 RepID=UPI00399EF87D